MSSMNHIYDAETALRAPKSEAITASGTVGEIPLDKLEKVRPSSQRNNLGAEGYTLVLNIESVEFPTTYDVGPPEKFPEEYIIRLDTGEAGATDTTVVYFKPNAAGNYVFPVDAQTIENMDNARSALALKLTVAGEAPSIKLNAWIV